MLKLKSQTELFFCSEDVEDPFNKDYLIEVVSLYVPQKFFIHIEKLFVL